MNLNIKRQMGDLNKRLAVSAIMICVAGLLITFSAHFWVSILVVCFIAALAGIGVWEYAKLTREKELKPVSTLMVIIAVCEVASFFVSLTWRELSLLPAVVLGVGIILFFLSHFKDSLQSIVNIAVEFFGICYVAVPLSFLLGVLYPPIAQDGRWWLVYLILVTKITDIGGYFIGRLWGKRPLAPVLSPKKTLEGAIAGFCFAVLASVGMHILSASLPSHAFDLTLFESLYLGMLIGIFAQVGDLAESLLKRDALVKDSNTLPGLGGILDMVDSLLFTTPIVYFFIKLH